ncbi:MULTISPECIES: SHOCT domain-containing protein [Rhodococcus]|uniref:SHOCT domain-containing protein n=1 Tax=Rhodococcus erythropolis TaxID=1833 RepID=A0A8I1D7H8_RHOER|nr:MULTISPECIES: SHOCT domain-containing protein [Rhodococcus]MBH5146370.1 SHOCT domain-containing protein [Rhodococcus erythropolis]QXC46855.1 SHOCT domain-containing protein [Rhodococcus qingshengii]
MLDSFWDLLWYTLIVFAFVAYLLILFQIIGDLFRDRTMPALARILWLIFLIAVPYLTAFLYILVRGRGIGERQAAAHDAARAAADNYIKDVAGTTPASQISEARALLDAGTITTAEYETLKAKALR